MLSLNVTGTHDMRSSGEHEQVQLALGLYVLGELSAAEDGRVERHLSHCDACQSASDELVVSAVLLTLVPKDEYATRHEVRHVPGPASPTAIMGSSTPNSTKRLERPRRRATKFAPAVRLVAVAAAVVLILGVGVGVWVDRLAQAPPRIEVAASATDATTNAMLSVQVRDQDGSAEVRAVIVGLRPGTAFQLLAVDAGGSTHVLYRGTAAGGPQTLVRDLPAPASAVRSVTVAQLDGTVVVSVQFTATSAP